MLYDSYCMYILYIYIITIIYYIWSVPSSTHPLFGPLNSSSLHRAFSRPNPSFVAFWRQVIPLHTLSCTGVALNFDSGSSKLRLRQSSRNPCKSKSASNCNMQSCSNCNTQGRDLNGSCCKHRSRLDPSQLNNRLDRSPGQVGDS